MATVSNLHINQASDFSTTVTLYVSDNPEVVMDLTGYTASAQIRKSYDSCIYTDMTTEFISPRTLGQITVSLTNDQTTSLDWGRYVWDLVITDSDGIKTRVVEGLAIIEPSVTRS